MRAEGPTHTARPRGGRISPELFSPRRAGRSGPVRCQDVGSGGDPSGGGEGEGDDQNDLFVSVTDLNRAGSPVVLNQVRINQGKSLAVEIQEDGHGSGKIEWAAQQVDHPTQTVHRTVTVSSGDTVEVTTFFG